MRAAATTDRLKLEFKSIFFRCWNFLVIGGISNLHYFAKKKDCIKISSIMRLSLSPLAFKKSFTIPSIIVIMQKSAKISSS